MSKYRPKPSLSEADIMWPLLHDGWWEQVFKQAERELRSIPDGW